MEKLKQDAKAVGGSANISSVVGDGSGAGFAGNGSVTGADGSGNGESAGRLALDAPTMSVIKDGERISLKAKEFALLKCLYDHKNTIVTKETLFDEVWGDTFYSDGTLNVHIRKIREAIEKDAQDPKYIVTVWKEGYKFVAPE